MDTKRIIQAEAARAEALIGKYLGFYAGDLVLGFGEQWNQKPT
ncbi:TPA: hypothetical protein ACG47G_006122 [Pseudomonas aeruginosa]